MEGIIGNDGEDAGGLRDQIADPGDQGTATGQDDAAGVNVGGELRGSALEDTLNRVDDGAKGLLNRLTNFTGGDGDAFGQSGAVVETAHLHVAIIIARIGMGRTNADLDLLGGGFTDH